MKAYELVEKGWTQGATARNKYGIETHHRSAEAVCWCAVGAICAAYMVSLEDYSGMVKAEEKIGSLESLADWNDDPARTQDEVVNLLKELDL
jgi:hypothetical protein